MSKREGEREAMISVRPIHRSNQLGQLVLASRSESLQEKLIATWMVGGRVWKTTTDEDSAEDDELATLLDNHNTAARNASSTCTYGEESLAA